MEKDQPFSYNFFVNHFIILPFTIHMIFSPYTISPFSPAALFPPCPILLELLSLCCNRPNWRPHVPPSSVLSGSFWWPLQKWKFLVRFLSILPAGESLKTKFGFFGSESQGTPDSPKHGAAPAKILYTRKNFDKTWKGSTAVKGVTWPGLSKVTRTQSSCSSV